MKAKQYFIWGVYEDHKITMDCVMAKSASGAMAEVNITRGACGGWALIDCAEAWVYMKHIARLATTDSDIVREEWEITKKNLT